MEQGKPKPMDDQDKGKTLHRPENHFQTAEQALDILLSLPDPVFVIQQNLSISFANHAAQAYCLKSYDDHLLSEVLGTSFLDEALGRCLRLGEQKKLSFRLDRHRRFYFEASILPLKKDLKASSTVLLILHDQTQIHSFDKLRSDFVANVSHELRTPLSSFQGFIDTMMGPAKGDHEAKEKFLRIMKAQAARMTATVEELLSLSSIELQESEEPTERVLLEPLLEQLVETLSYKAKERDIVLLFEAPIFENQGRRLEVQGDEKQLWQLFRNLIENAIKYGKEKSEVSILVSLESADTIKISVIDQGEGILEKHIPRLTERFYRVDKARSRKVGGTGLGLAIVKHIVNRHKGQLLIESQVGEGSNFSVTLPLL